MRIGGNVMKNGENRFSSSSSSSSSSNSSKPADGMHIIGRDEF